MYIRIGWCEEIGWICGWWIGCTWLGLLPWTDNKAILAMVLNQPNNSEMGHSVRDFGGKGRITALVISWNLQYWLNSLFTDCVNIHMPFFC